MELIVVYCCSLSSSAYLHTRRSALPSGIQAKNLSPTHTPAGEAPSGTCTTQRTSNTLPAPRPQAATLAPMPKWLHRPTDSTVPCTGLAFTRTLVSSSTQWSPAGRGGRHVQGQPSNCVPNSKPGIKDLCTHGGVVTVSTARDMVNIFK